MKTEIEIVTGFLGSGKTTFINALIYNTIVKNERLIVLLCEKGNKAIDDDITSDKRVEIVYYPSGKPLSNEYIKYILNLQMPHRLIIEHNGTRPINETFDMLSNDNMRKCCSVTSVFHVTDAKTFNIYFDNLKPLILPCVKLSNLILLNNIDAINEDEKKIIIEKIEKDNSNAFILGVKGDDILEIVLCDSNILDKGIMKKARYFIKNILKL